MNLKTLLCLPLLLLIASSASAAFSLNFQISPAGTPLISAPDTFLFPGQSATFEVYAVKSGGGGNGLSITVEGTLAFSGTGFTLTSNNVQTSTPVVFSANGPQQQSIGTFTVQNTSAAPFATATAQFTDISISGSNFISSAPNGPYAPTNIVNITAVPEPTSLALVGLGGLGFAFYRKRRSKTASAEAVTEADADTVA
jgi:hypothetical protein